MKLRKEALSELFQITVGIVLASIGLKAFLLPNGFLDGGVTGIAILISRLIEVDISLLLFVLSIPFLVLAYYTVSKRILVKSTFSILALSIMIHFENFSIITDDKLLISIFGGLFLGMGIGLSIRNGAVLDGSEVLGVFLNDRYGISIGRIILIFNVILFSLTALSLSVETALYSTLTYLVTAKVIDSMIKGFEDFIGLRVISKQSDQIKEALINQLGVGVTLYKGAGGYGNSGEQNNMEIVDTIINRLDLRKAHQIIDHIDPTAFTVEYDVNAIKGGVLRRYLQKRKKYQSQHKK